MSMIHDIVGEQSGEIATLHKRIEELEKQARNRNGCLTYHIARVDRHRKALEEIAKLAPVYQRAVNIATDALREE